MQSSQIDVRLNIKFVVILKNVTIFGNPSCHILKIITIYIFLNNKGLDKKNKNLYTWSMSLAPGLVINGEQRENMYVYIWF